MELPGNATHQKILTLFINLFQRDKNVRAFIVFGSLARGNWDNYSDLDLDVIVKDAAAEKIQQEKNNILTELNREKIKVLLCFEEFANEFVFILDSLDRIGIRFHLLDDTHPSIIDSMKILYGDLTLEKIKASQNPLLKKMDNFSLLNDKFLEHAIYVPLSLKRNKLINAAFFLNRMRQIIIEIYTKARGKREFDFEKIAEDQVKQEIYKTHTPLNANCLEAAFTRLINLYRSSIEYISLGKIKLTANEKLILEKVINY